MPKKADKKEKIKLSVEKRKITGRKVKVLRRDGFLPANIYGKKVKSLAVQLKTKDFLPVFKEAGETTLVELELPGEEKMRPVLIHNVHFHPVSGDPLHADFYQVDLKQKVTSKIPVELIGESSAVKEKIGILIQPLNEVEVEALPADLPEKIEADISDLKAINDIVSVNEIKVPSGVKILTDQKEILAKIEPPAKEEEIAPPAEEEVPAEGEEEPIEEGEGKAEAEGEAPATEGKPETKKEEEKTSEETPKEEKK
jgi:large subunit ribosomal protein L25